MITEHAILRSMSNLSQTTYQGFKYNPNVFAPGAKCPNHRCRLYLTDQVGKGICEISGVYFDYDEGPVKAGDQSKNMANEFEIKILNGKMEKVFKPAPAGFIRGNILTRK